MKNPPGKISTLKSLPLGRCIFPFLSFLVAGHIKLTKTPEVSGAITLVPFRYNVLVQGERLDLHELRRSKSAHCKFLLWAAAG
jgi:hypothetical protein